MAAPQWSGGKCKDIGKIKAWFRHNEPEERMEANHTNPHIDKAKTHLNFSYRGLDYGGLCAAFDERMGDVWMGRESSGKNARVLLQSVIVYLPAGLADKDTDTKRRWFERVGDILDERYGADFLDMQVDFDENHEYFDPETKEMVMSREHGHARLFPAVDGRLNAKAFSSRAAINGLNKALQEMSVKEFGVPMMDGSKAKGGQTVEQLKAKSEAAKIIADAEAEAEATRKAAGATRSAAKAQAGEIMAEAEKARQEAVEARQRAERERQALNTRRGQLEAWERELDEREEALEQREAVVSRKEAALTALGRERYERKQMEAQQQRQAERSEAAAALIAPTVTPEKHGKRAGKIPPSTPQR